MARDSDMAAERRVIRLAHVANLYDGIWTTMGPKLRALDSYEDLAVTIITPPGKDRPGRQLPVRFIAAPIPRSIRPWADLRCLIHLWRMFKRERFDMVHTHTAKAGVLGTLAAWLAGVPLVYHTYHGLPHYPGQPAWPYHLYRTIEKLACRLRHHIFSQNRRELPECAGLIGDPARVHYEGNGTDPGMVRANAAAQRAAGETYFTGRGTRLLIVSRLEPVKHVGDFVRCVRLLRDEGAEVCGVIAGEGIVKEEIRRQVAELGLADCVQVVGYVVECHGLIAACDIMVLASEKEGIPRSLMEAMVLEKPVVATDVVGTQELVADGETGFLVPLGDVRAMAERLKTLIHDEDLRRRLGAAGARRVEAQFNDLRIADFLHAFYVREFDAWQRRAGARRGRARNAVEQTAPRV